METFWLKEKYSDKGSTKTPTTCLGSKPEDAEFSQVKDKGLKITEGLAKTPT